MQQKMLSPPREDRQAEGLTRRGLLKWENGEHFEKMLPVLWRGQGGFSLNAAQRR